MRAPAALWLVAVVGLASPAIATPTLQLDVNSISIQTRDGAGMNSGFGGLMHTGSIGFTMAAPTSLNGVFIQTSVSGPFANAGFSGSLSSFTGTINLVNGLVTGGSLGVFVNGGSDSYTCSIVPNVGSVTTFVGGGFKVEGLTFQGQFSDAQFGNVNVAPWATGNLPGSFLQFNFDPSASGAGFADMDLFVDVVPLPSAAWTGLATLGCIAAVGRIRRRR